MSGPADARSRRTRANGGDRTPHPEDVEELLDAALELEPEEWPAFVDETCGDDETGLRQEVEALLARRSRLEDFLEPPPAVVVSGPGDLSDGDRLLGRRLGPYRIVDEIGRGGMGEVFLAERADGQFEQRVAVKLLRAGVRSEETVRRFRAERQILAGVDHPSIARLVDGGVTDDGRPYLVAEYVEGVPIDRYCDGRRLPVAERLRLFVEVAEAVQHAHRNLVVHRDLKPSNILVDASGRVRLLDFGIAKLLDEDDPDADGSSTRPGRRWMTPDYAAPEQVTGGAVTTATDVHQLGVVLYELLTGRHPFGGEAGSRYRLERAIVETAPARPSTAATDLEGSWPAGEPGLDPEAVARARGMRPAELRRALRGDLDAIVLKALRKDPDDRYASARALGEDVERHLEGRPVAARRGTLAYRVRKFAGRHRWGVGAAAAVLLLLVGFAIFATAQADRLATERDRAQQATAFVTGLLGELEPVRTPGPEADLRNLLDRAVERGRGQLAEQPLLRAELFDALGEAYQYQGFFAEADRLLAEALELRQGKLDPDHLAVAESRVRLGVLRATTGDAGADSLLEAAADTYRRKLGPDAPELQRARVHRALALRDRGDFAAAADLFRRVLAATAGAGGPAAGRHSRLTALTYLGKLLTWAGRHEQADGLLTEALRLAHTLHSEDHPVAANVLEAGAELRLARGDADAAEAALRRVQAVRREFFREDHFDLAAGHLNRGRIRLEQGRPAAADAALQEVLEVYRRDLGDGSRDVAQVLGHLARARWALGDTAGADSLARRALDIWRRQPGRARHPYVSDLLLYRASWRLAEGRPGEAEALAREARSIRQATLPDGAPRVLEAGGWVGAALAAQGRLREAEAQLRASHGGLLKAVGPDHPLTRTAADRLDALHASSR